LIIEKPLKTKKVLDLQAALRFIMMVCGFFDGVHTDASGWFAYGSEK